MDEAWQPPTTGAERGRRRSSRLSSASKSEVSEKDAQSIGESKQPNESQPRRSNRQRKPPANTEPAESIEELLKPLTDEERNNWKGWVELESDPALFNHVLREYGVKDVKIQEVLSLDDEMLDDLPMPIYGLVFLFKYRDSDSEEEEQTLTCPDHVWFANQTTASACATVALLNIVMNVPEINLGPELSAFRDTTESLSPARRGYKLGHNSFIRRIHNSSARRIDIRNADLALANEVAEWEKAQKAKKRKAKGRKKTTKKLSEDDEPGFHFIAYVPINGEVWRLDGLQRMPVNLGGHGNRWVAAARENIHQRIGQYDEDGLQFNLLALCRSPLQQIPGELAQIQCSIAAVEGKLNSLIPDWKAFLEVSKSPASMDLDDAYGITKEILSAACVSQSVQRRLANVEADPGQLLELYKELTQHQDQLRLSYVQEVALVSQENEQVTTGYIDYTPLIHASMEALAEANIWDEILQGMQD